MVIDCKQIKSRLIEEIKEEISQLKIDPKLQIIMVGKNDASDIYVRNKKNLGIEIGVDVEVISLPFDTSEQQLLETIDQINMDDSVHGLFVQLPVPSHISEQRIINQINPNKDVDGFCNVNTGKLVNGVDTMFPCTADAVITILNELKFEYYGANIVIAGRSNIVGKPLANMLINKGATVTVVNSKTKNIKQFIDSSDVFISAIGQPRFFTTDFFEDKEDLIVIDIGINRDEQGKLCGDIDFDNVKNKVGAITPVPGGVGVLTVTHVMRNMLKAITKENV